MGALGEPRRPRVLPSLSENDSQTSWSGDAVCLTHRNAQGTPRAVTFGNIHASQWTGMCCGQGKTDTQLSNPSQFLICIGTDIPKIRVPPSAVVEHFDISDDIISGLLTRGVRPMRCPFAF